MRLFIYLSEVLKRNVVDQNGNSLGKLHDVSMKLNSEVFPQADCIVIVRGLFIKEYARVAFEDIDDFRRRIRLKIAEKDVQFTKGLARSDFSLRRDILDQQVVDTDDQKVVRVNDVHMLRVDNQLYLAHVDVGLRGIFRRLEWSGFVDFIVKLFKPDSAYLKEEMLISWKNTHVLSSGPGKNVLRSADARKKLSKIPTEELADIMEDLDIFERLSLFKTFSLDMQQKIFMDLAPQEKEELIDQLDDKEAGSLLENIPADEATDLLNELPAEQRMRLLRRMHSKTSKQLRKLLGFSEDSAGGLMTTEYLFVEEDALVGDALQLIKKNVDKPVNLFFVYIVDKHHKLLGTTSLRRFITQDNKILLIKTCYEKNIYVNTDSDMEEIAILLEKYKLTSIPVLDEKEILQGVITIDDVMEELISLAWSKYKDQL